MDPIQRVGVVGCGLMGSGIAEVCARAGLEVIVREPEEKLLEAGKARIERSLQRAQKSKKMTAEEGESALRLIAYTTELAEFAGCDLVVEAIIENQAAKIEVFKKLDAIVTREDALLTSNTSSIPIMSLAVQTGRASQVCGLHFFNPVPVLDLVELVPSLTTSDETLSRLEGFASEVLGKSVIRAQDRAGFIVNALLVPYLLSAIRMAESGFATVEHIDAGMVKGCNHPMGPLALTDLIGLDTTMAIAQCLYDEFKEPQFASPPLLSRMVEAGRFAPSAGNCQPYKFIVITDREVITEIEHEAMKALRRAKNLYYDDRGRRLLWKNAVFTLFSLLAANKMDPRPFTAIEKADRCDEMIYWGAPAVILICKHPRGISNPDLDGGMAAQNMVLAAHALGLGTCYIGLTIDSMGSSNMKKIREKIGLRPPWEPLTSIAVGYPKGRVDAVVKRDTPTVEWIE